MDFPLPDGYIYRLVKNEENKECIFQIKEISDKNQALIDHDMRMELLNHPWTPDVSFKFPTSGRRNPRFVLHWLLLRMAHIVNIASYFQQQLESRVFMQKWLQDWSNLTKVTWRINRTYPRSGRHNCFKVDMKCQNAANKRVKAVHTKKTGCTATLQIKITGFCENIPADQDDLNRDWPTNITIRGTHNHELNSTEAPSELVHHDQTSSSDISENNIPTLSAEDKEAFNNLIRRITSGIETKPEIFVPALRQMLENVEKFASTEAGLIKAMHTFGICNRTLDNNHVKKLIKKSHAVRTGVQPTAAERRRKYLTGKKKLCIR